MGAIIPCGGWAGTDHSGPAAIVPAAFNPAAVNPPTAGPATIRPIEFGSAAIAPATAVSAIGKLAEGQVSLHNVQMQLAVEGLSTVDDPDLDEPWPQCGLTGEE